LGNWKEGNKNCITFAHLSNREQVRNRKRLWGTQNILLLYEKSRCIGWQVSNLVPPPSSFCPQLLPLAPGITFANLAVVRGKGNAEWLGFKMKRS
jgi:hypothetical protein